MPEYRTFQSSRAGRKFSGPRLSTCRRISGNISIPPPASPLCEGANHLVKEGSPHLQAWSMPQNLWTSLPKDLQNRVQAVQYAGASVQAGIARVQKLWKESGGNVTEENLWSKTDILAPNSPVTLNDIAAFNSAAVTPGLTDATSTSTSPAASRKSSFLRIAYGLQIDLKEDDNNSQEIMSEMESVSPLQLSSPFMPPQNLEALNRNRSASDVTPKDDLPELVSICISDSSTKPRRSTISVLTNEHQVVFIPPPRSHFVYKWRAELAYLRDEPLVEIKHGMEQIANIWKQIQQQEAIMLQSYKNSLMEGKTNSSTQVTRSHRDPLGWRDLKYKMDEWITEKQKLVLQLVEQVESYEGAVICRWGETRRGSLLQ